MPEGSGTVTLLLNRWRAGDSAAAGQLIDLVYGELHRIASREMCRERAGHTLQTTALVHEAYIRLCEGKAVNWADRAHFYAVAAQQLRRILVDHARKTRSEKRGGNVIRLSLLESDGAIASMDERLVAVDEALSRLEFLDEEAAKVVELRFFGGLTEAEAAEVLGISLATLKRDWDFARAWLTRHLS
jgi:RNA polymerase sigma factor (TIGR02999 family)